MTRRFFDSAPSAVVIAALISLGAPGAAAAQSADGFLFKQPNVAVKFETGYGFQRASSEIFDFVTTEHTLERDDFDAPYIGGEIAVRLHEQVDLTLSIGYQGSSKLSEFRDFVGTDDLPIEQVTELRIVPAVVGVKYYLQPRGRSIGRFAWVPTDLVPYVGAGIGVASYRFEQYGEFIDFDTFDIFYDEFVSEQDAFLARAVAGLDYSLSERFLLSAEGRYGWASSEMGRDFVDFDNIDLDGLQLVVGIAVRF